MRTELRGVYVHVPFCRRRCPYCDFAFEVRAPDPRYAPAVVDELRARQGELNGPADTVSFGGGTPSALPVRDIARIIEGIRSTVGVAPGAEVSAELNPEDVDDAYVAGLRDAGVNRVSLGVQSFDDDVLRYLGRAHDGARARSVVDLCVRAGLRVGVDLIVGVPGEAATRLARDVDELRALAVGHVSAYLLTVEEGTPLVQLIATGARAAVDEEHQADAYEVVQELLSRPSGTSTWRQYEVSSYARPGEESRHNRLYWQGGAYLGVGPSAHSMSPGADGSVVRRHTTARLDAWLPTSTNAAHTIEVLAPERALLEWIAFGLRDIAAGVQAPPHVVPTLRSLGDDVVYLEATDRWHLTHKGARFADRVARAVLAVDVRRG